MKISGGFNAVYYNYAMIINSTIYAGSSMVVFAKDN